VPLHATPLRRAARATFSRAVIVVQAVAMAAWSVVAREAPEVAAVATGLWPGLFALDRGHAVPAGQHAFPIAYLATVRRDGAPRLHPFCPILADGRLFAAIPGSSPKGWDLRRDPRCVIHAMPGPDDDEMCIRAMASEVAAEGDSVALVQSVVARSEVGGMQESVRHHPIFEFDVLQVDVAHWLRVGQPDTEAVRQQWRRGRRST
jgi:hypothetical protein